MVTLRDMTPSDIRDYVRWFTVCTSWMETDAPWENAVSTPEEELAGWKEYYEAIRDLPADDVRWKFEIDWNGRHVGWVCAYTDLEYVENPHMIPAVGIDIPEADCRGQGVGTEALRQFVRYLGDKGYPRVYTQTWSGNTAMLRVAEKLGFTPICRLPGHRIVRGKTYDALTFQLETGALV